MADTPPAECSPNWRNCNKKRCIFFSSYSAVSIHVPPASCFCSKRPVCLGFVSPALWFLPRYTTPVPTPRPPNTHSITDPETKQAECLPACTQLPQGRSQERALLFSVVKIGRKIKGKKILNVSISPAFCFSFCKYSALFFREKLLIVSYPSNHHEP